jgi:Tfp pilus assembly protein PilF
MAGIRPPWLRQADLEVTPTRPSDGGLPAAARLLKNGRLEDAVRICLAVAKQSPENTAAWSLLGNARVAQKQYANAIRCYGRVLAAAPDSTEVLNNLGAVHQLCGESKRAAECFRRALALKPNYAQAYCNLGVALRKLGSLDDAIACQHRAIEIAPDYAKAHYNLGNALKEASERDASIRAYEQAIAHDPGHAEAHNNLGTVLEGQGHTAKALAEFSSAMAMDESYVEAHYNHALLHRFQAGEHALDKLQKLGRQEGQSPPNKNRLAFALAKARADLGDYDTSFTLYAPANAERRQRSNYDKSAAEHEIEKIIAANIEAPKSVFPAETEGAPIPIFVLGLSRSGKTLVESLLTSQADVFAAGESEHWQRLRRDAKRMGSNQTAPGGLGAAYRQEMRRLSGDAQYFVNTLDTNILSLAEITTVLPEARLVLCLREPLDNALLMYFKRYEQGHAHAYDFEDIAHFMAQRSRLQAHWRGLFGERIMTLEYETLVHGGAAVAARIAAHVGLRFDPAAALPEFHEEEIGVWKCYEKHIDPLRAALARYQGTK